MINALIEKVLQGQYPYVKKEDGTFVFCAEGNQEKMGSVYTWLFLHSHHLKPYLYMEV